MAKKNKGKEEKDIKDSLKQEVEKDTPKEEDQLSEDKNDNVIDFESKKSEKDKADQESKDIQAEINDLKDTIRRTQADFMNFKRRTEEEKEKTKAFANESIIMGLLEVVDNFERALDQDINSGEAFIEGLQLIKKQILDLLEKNHVQVIDNDIDFDPNFHYAVMQEEGEKPNQILEVFQKGYLLKDKVIRPSMVKVSK